jgi:hypothetical protein
MANAWKGFAEAWFKYIEFVTLAAVIYFLARRTGSWSLYALTVISAGAIIMYVHQYLIMRLTIIISHKHPWLNVVATGLIAIPLAYFGVQLAWAAVTALAEIQLRSAN